MRPTKKKEKKNSPRPHLQYHAHGLRGKLDRTRRDKERLYHAPRVHVADATVLHVDARADPTLGVRLPQFRDDLDGPQPGVLGEGVRYHLERVGVRAEAVRVQSRSGHRHLPQPQGRLRLGGPTPGDDTTDLHEGPHDALRVVDRSVRLGEDEVVRSAEEDRHGPARIRHTHELHDLVTRSGEDDVPDVLGRSELLGAEGIDVRDRCAPQGAAYELDVVPLNVRDHDVIILMI